MRYSFRLAAFALLLGGAFAGSARADMHALLIGINDYPNARKLKGAVNDIQAIRKVLADDLKFPEGNVEVLLNEQASKAAIIAGVQSLARRARAGDTILIYYSGHGWLIDDVNKDEGSFDPSEKFDQALVPYDAVPWPKARAHEPNPTLLTDDELAPLLARLYGRRLAVVFDSCHAGSGLRGLPGEDETRSLYPDVPLPVSPLKSLTPRRPTLDLTGQVVFLAAAQWKQTASDLGEFDGRRHGALTAGMLRVIRQAGPGWPKTMTWDGLTRQIKSDLVGRGVASQTPNLTAPPGLARLSFENFFQPLPASEIAEITTPPAFELYLEANRYQFLEGEQLELAIESERDGYLYLFDINPEQKVTQLFPNRFDPDNRVFAGALRKVPTKHDRYQFTAGKPFGVSTVVALVTSKPWAELSQLSLPQSLQPITELQKTGLAAGFRNLEESARAFAAEAVDPAPAGDPAPAAKSAAAAEWATQKIALEVVTRRVEAPSIVLPPKPAPAAPVATATAPAAPKPVTAPAAAPASSRANSADDSDLTPEEQKDLATLRPALYRKLEQLAERYSPTFWQDVGGEADLRFRPWRDFFVRYDFDRTANGPNWPSPPGFQDETKRIRLRALDAWLTPSSRRNITQVEGFAGLYQVRDESTGETVQLDLRPAVYWAVLTTRSHYFFHYMCFKAEDWKPVFGHPGDLEGATVVVDRQSEKPVALLTLAHDDVEVTRGLESDEPESNIEVMVAPSLQTRGLQDEERPRPINGVLGMDATRAGEVAAKEHQDVYSETKGHGQYGAHKIHPSRYIIFGSYFPDEAWTAPSFDIAQYPVTDKFEEVKAKYKYRLIYVGSGDRKPESAEQKTLWSEYRDLRRFPGGVNPPWCWRDKLWFRTGWWRDPRTILKVGDDQYLFNPYLE